MERTTTLKACNEQTKAKKLKMNKYIHLTFTVKQAMNKLEQKVQNK